MRRGRERGQAATATATTAELVPDLSVAEPRVRLGDLLVHSGVVSRDALELVTPHTNGQRLGEALVERGVVDEDDLTRALSEQLHVPVVDLRDAAPSPDAIALVEPPDAHSYDVLPLIVSDDGTLTVAVADPLNTNVMRLLKSLPVREVHVALGVPTQLVVYPGEKHGIVRPSYQKDRVERYLAWYAKYVKPPAALATTDANGH